eukprot:jgi/Bigna1/131482/aug1.14_g6190
MDGSRTQSSLKQQHPKSLVFLSILRGGYTSSYFPSYLPNENEVLRKEYELETNFLENEAWLDPSKSSELKNITDDQMQNVRRKFLAKWGNYSDDWEINEYRKMKAENLEKWDLMEQNLLKPFEKVEEGISKNASRAILEEISLQNVTGTAPRMFHSMDDMVAHIQALGRIETQKIRKNFIAVDRKDFSFSPVHSYSNLGTIFGVGPILSSPWFHFEALERIRGALQPGGKVLIVGAGSGYLACIMARMVRSESEGGHVDITERDKSSLVSAEYNIRKNHEFLIEDRVVRMHLVDEPHMGIQQEMRRGQQEEETKYDAIYVTEQPGRQKQHLLTIFLKYECAVARCSFYLLDVLCRQLTENGTLIVPNFQIAKEPESSDDDEICGRDGLEIKNSGRGKTAEDMEEIFKSSIDEENVHKRVKHARKMRQKERKERRKAREAKKKPYSNRGDPLENYAYFIEYTPANRSSTDTATLSFGGAVNKIRREITWMELHQQDSK